MYESDHQYCSGLVSCDVGAAVDQWWSGRMNVCDVVVCRGPLGGPIGAEGYQCVTVEGMNHAVV